MEIKKDTLNFEEKMSIDSFISCTDTTILLVSQDKKVDITNNVIDLVLDLPYNGVNFTQNPDLNMEYCLTLVTVAPLFSKSLLNLTPKFFTSIEIINQNETLILDLSQIHTRCILSAETSIAMLFVLTAIIKNVQLRPLEEFELVKENRVDNKVKH